MKIKVRNMIVSTFKECHFDTRPAPAGVKANID